MRKVFLIFFVLLFVGCGVFSSYTGQVNKLKESFISDNTTLFKEDFERFFKNSPKNRLCLTLEKSVADYIWKEYDKSLRNLNKANSIVKDMDRRAEVTLRGSTQQAFSLLLNEKVLDYRLNPFEKVYLHIFMAMNYSHLSSLDEALVEVKNIEYLLRQEYKRQSKEFKILSENARKENYNMKIVLKNANKGLPEDLRFSKTKEESNRFFPFGYFLSAIYDELLGEYNDAIVNYRYLKSLVPQNMYIWEKYLLLCKNNGYYDEYEEYKGKYKISEKDGEVIFIIFNDFIAQKRELKLPIPIYGTIQWIALPYYPKKEPYWRGFDVFYKGKEYPSYELENLSYNARMQLKRLYPILLMKQAIRLYIKASIGRKLRKESGDTGAIAASIFSYITEQADLRGWYFLPHNINIIRVPADSGENTFILTLLSGKSSKISTVIKANIKKGKKYLVEIFTYPGKIYINKKEF